MSDSVGEPPGSLDGTLPTPIDQDLLPTATEPTPADSPPLDGEGPPLPLEGKNSTSPPESSITFPPPDISSSSPPPPSNVNSTPPLPPSSSNSSVPSPPSNSGSSPPLPPPHSNSSVSSPPSGFNTSQSPPPSQSVSSPPSSPVASSSSSSPPPPPPNSSLVHPPLADPSQSTPPSGTPPASGNSSPLPPLESPPAEPLPIPAVSNGPPPLATGSSGLPPPVQIVFPPLPETPPSADPSPQLPVSPPATVTSNPTPSIESTPSAPSISTPPASQTPNHVPKLTLPSTPSNPSSSTLGQTNSESSSSSEGGTVAGVTVAGVLLIAFVAFFFIIKKRKKRRARAFAARHGSKPGNFSVKSDGYYYRQQHTVGDSSQSDGNYNGKPPHSPSAIGNSHGNYRGGAPESGVIGGTKLSFSYEELMTITNGFSRQSVIGEGGFGCVYKGWLSDGRVVAVKQLKAGSGQGEREFRAEVEIISRVHHRHLVSLVGYCIAEHHRLLVYEFVPNNNLDHHLHGKGIPVLEWSKRVKIAIGAARGLAYLHEDCHPKIIHRDIKSANILLDDTFEAQVADFGLAKLSNDTNTHVSTRVMGTFGYMAPEYASSGKLTEKSDVFSFGVVLLELVTGRKPVDPNQPLGDESLVEWARPLLIRALDTGDFAELTDPKLEKRYVESEMFRMIEAAAACVRHSAPKRPRMVQVVRALDNEGDMPDLTNGVKFGQSTVYDSGQYSAEIQRFRMMAFGGGDSSIYDTSSGEYNSKEIQCTPPHSWRPGESGSHEFPSSESEAYAMNPQGSASYENCQFGQKRIF